MYLHTGHWSANRRITVLVVCLTMLVALAGLAAWWTGRSDSADRPAAQAPGPSSPGPSSPPPPAGGTGGVAKPPQIADPLAYGKAAAQVLWTYDTRTTTHAQQLAGLHAWVTRETQYADWAGVQAQIPDPVLWSRMHDNGQHATALISEAHFPSSFKQALADDPAALTQAYIYAVTVTGKQQITWSGGGAGAEDRTVTLAVQCRPDADCSLVAIAPRVLP
ncbi:hypothetical protein ACODT3_25180 [Streptomyces sp. 4.24]|uniref:hypothetical protein n=1 Tax=Streptomyces tritrimontium TaxID=3406573 RepID=UPI003BB5638A